MSGVEPLPLRARLRGRHRQPRRRDRRGAADGPLLRRLDDRLGEHDRGRPGRALDRLLARRQARRSLPAPARALPAGRWRRRRCWRWSRSRRGPSSTSRSTPLDEISAGRLRRLAGRGAVPDRRPGGPARHLLALGDPARGARRRALRADGRPPLRDLHRRLAAGDDAGGAGADPASSAPSAPSSSSRSRSALVAAAGLGWRYLAVPGGAGGRDRDPGRDGEGDREARRCCSRGRPRSQYIRVVEEEDGDRLLELNEGQAVHSLYRPGSYLTDDVWDGYLVLPFAAPHRAAGADRDPRQRRRHHRPRLRPLLPRRPRSTGSRSTPS